MSYNGTIVGSPTFGAAKFSDGLTATSDSNYISLPSGGGWPGTAVVTWEAWLKSSSTPGAAAVALSLSSDPTWFGMLSNGHFACSINGGSNIDSGVAINDGNWHHCAVVITNTEAYTFVDGSAGASAAVSITVDAPADAVIGTFGYTTGFPWLGSIDEVAIWNFQKYTGSYTVPSSAYAGTESGLNALYHLNDNADDSNMGPTTTTIDPSSTDIIYSPFNWNVVTGNAATINAGAYFRTIFSGSQMSLTTSTAPDSTPYSQLWARIDNQAWQLFTLSAGNPTLVIGTGLDTSKKHMLEVVIKATTQTLNRWSSSQTVVEITGLVIDGGASLTQPTRRSKNILIYGDSITEGIRVYGDALSPDVEQNDALGCYSYALATALDAEVGVVAFGGTGITVSGSGGVPDLPSSYNYLYSGTSRSFSSPAPDLVIYNEGTNDSSSITSGLETVINAIIAAAPSSKHLILVPFNGTHASEISAAVSAIGSANVTSHSTTGWLSSGDTVDGTHPYNYASVDFIAPLLFPVVTAILYPAGGAGGGSFACA